MRKAAAVKPGADFTRPDTVMAVAVDPSTGYKAADGCPEKRDEFYIAGTEPTEICPAHGAVSADPVIPPLPPEGPKVVSPEAVADDVPRKDP